jgi:hypothetical protein
MRRSAVAIRNSPQRTRPGIRGNIATIGMRIWPALLLFVATIGAGAPAGGHQRTLEECLEGGDFIANAARARDNGITKAEFLNRLLDDIQLIQAFPPQLRWFVVDPDDAELLHDEATKVFDTPRRPEAHRTQFLSRCFAQ